jgi:hypothetical protein
MSPQATNPQQPQDPPISDRLLLDFASLTFLLIPASAFGYGSDQELPRIPANSRDL